MNEVESKLWRPDIIGWSLDILPYYASIINNFPDNAKLVEVGVFEGRSVLFMLEELKKINKNVSFSGIDFERDCPYVLQNNNQYSHHKMTSVDAAKLFDDKSLDFVFIDANHKYDYVSADIAAWFPKVKSGGIISGHDYNADEMFFAGPNETMGVWPEEGVVRAVDEFFGKENIKLYHTCWEHTVK